MPQYEYRCQGCGESFVEVMTFAEKDTRVVSCPHCGSSEVRQVFTSFFAKTSRKS